MTKETDNRLFMENEQGKDFLKTESDKQLIEDVDISPSFVSEEGDGKDLEGMFPETGMKHSAYQDEFSHEPVIKHGRTEEDEILTDNEEQ
ncbi:hypothetical protein NCCP2222_33880 [Sporosarcina sp. NCCP-2222]|uniref:hypothetical protein n=1 Tax=Sporosarcina sp. NCCP-2222 TaxID=2935073 RepID=UPI00207DA916|nr:hypothetical protein [Sporosarcina sp. NCCP-2222]GKV57441.1 hypothetical protein NCCP2222_33880 [Sporosarcina sp. NCCP-2222]